MNKPSRRVVPFAKLIPNIITMFGICVGLTALRFALVGNITLALYLLVLAMILDAVDGKIARVMNSQSVIGAELDTLADFFNFGIATPLVLFLTVFANSNVPNLGWLTVLTMSISCAFRLARFNVALSENPAPEHFVGVPAPAVACLSLTPLLFVMLGVDVTEHYAVPSALFLLFTGFLAVATFPTFSLKEFAVPARHQYFVIFGIAMLLTCLLVFPWHTLLVGNALYLLILPIYALRQNRTDSAHHP